MPYTPPYPSGWEDYPNTSTPITAAALDAIDTGITDAYALADTIYTVQFATITTNYTLALTDRHKIVRVNNSATATITVPPDSSVPFPNGSQVTVVAQTLQAVVFAAGSGVIVRATPGLQLRDIYSMATLIKYDTDDWYLVGDLA